MAQERSERQVGGRSEDAMAHETTGSEVLYRRALPGGGVVLIRASNVRSAPGLAHVRGEVVVERRTDASRREGHVPPVVAVADQQTKDAVLRELFPLVNSNTALALACLTRAARQPSPAEHAGAH
jgi:hypothetical protein